MSCKGDMHIATACHGMHDARNVATLGVHGRLATVRTQPTHTHAPRYRRACEKRCVAPWLTLIEVRTCNGTVHM